MADRSYSIKRLTIAVEGQVISDLIGGMDPEVNDAAPERIRAGGRKAIAYAEFPDANEIDYEFSVASPSDDEHFLDDIIDNHRTVTFAASYEVSDDYPDGAFTGITGSGKLTRSGRRMEDSIEARVYTMHMNGFTRTYKNRPSIVKG